MLTDNLPQAAANTITHDGRSESARRDKAAAKTRGVTCFKNAQQDQATTFNAAAFLDAIKFG